MMTNLKALLKFTREQITKGTLDITVDDYAELEYICGKVEGEVERLEEVLWLAMGYKGCPYGHTRDSRCIAETCVDCWKDYISSGGE